MGGYGSGSHHYYTPRATVESRLRLDVRRLHRAGLLAPSAAGSTSWYRNDQQTGAISHAAKGEGEGQATALELSYALNGELVSQRVELQWTPCHYGGARPWLLFPLCSRRVAILYSGQRFACRHCHDLAYASTRESAVDRGIYRAQRIHRRLGGTGNLLGPFPPKPKGMHWRTYDRLESEAREAYYRSLLGTMERMNRALGRLEGR